MSASRLAIGVVSAVLAATLVTVAFAGRDVPTASGACDLPQGAERVAIDPADFRRGSTTRGGR